MKKSIPNSIYGPVESWRLGKSLGVDLLRVDSICSFECVYCQLGKINLVTTKREIFVSTEEVLRDLEKSEWKAADVITFSGSGEPTLAANLGEVIEKTKKFTGKSVAVLTNSTLLHLSAVRREISQADKIFCKLDAWSDEILHRINRPQKDTSLERVISGIELLRSEFKNFLAVQTMILRPPKNSEIENFAETLRSIKPDEVQLNLPTRPVPREYVVETRGNAVEFCGEYTKLKSVAKDELEIIRQRLSELTDLPIITR